MTITHRVTTSDELKLAMQRIDELLATNPDVSPGTPEGDELESPIETAMRYESEDA